jgi:RAD51-like protein 2
MWRLFCVYFAHEKLRSQMSTRELISLPLAPSLIDNLAQHGFRVLSDFDGMKPLDLCQEIKSLTPEIALQVLQEVSKNKLQDNDQIQTSGYYGAAHNSLQTTAKDLMMKMSVHRPIITFCKEVDMMLGGGIPIGQITEFCGVPGVSIWINPSISIGLITKLVVCDRLVKPN